MITEYELRDLNIVHITAIQSSPSFTIDELIDNLRKKYGDNKITIMVDNPLEDGGFFDELNAKDVENFTVIYNMAATSDYDHYKWNNKITGMACFKCIKDSKDKLLRINDTSFKPYQEGNILLFTGHDSHVYSVTYLDKNLMPIKIVACYDMMDLNFTDENTETKLIGPNGSEILERIPLSEIKWLNPETIKNIKEQ